jgi:alpha-tubulin suppressor-like RCC1 family protein
VALKGDGTVVAWGLNGSGQCDVPANLSGVTAIAAGWGFTAALKSDGTVVAWGGGQIQNTGLTILSGAVGIAAGGDFIVALKNDGTVVARGVDAFGQCDVPIGLSGVTAIAAGAEFAVALKNDGTVVTWGGTVSPGGGTVLESAMSR